MKLKLCHHIILTPRYRRPVFANAAYAASFRADLEHITTLRHVQVLALAVMPDHVHLMLALPTGLALGKAMQDIKWFTSLYLRNRYPALKSDRALWGKRYWARTVGGDSSRVYQYIAQNIPGENP